VAARARAGLCSAQFVCHHVGVGWTLTPSYGNTNMRETSHDHAHKGHSRKSGSLAIPSLVVALCMAGTWEPATGTGRQRLLSPSARFVVSSFSLPVPALRPEPILFLALPGQRNRRCAPARLAFVFPGHNLFEFATPMRTRTHLNLSSVASAVFGGVARNLPGHILKRRFTSSPVCTCMPACVCLRPWHGKPHLALARCFLKPG
jgi:hypothetical protein